MLGPSAPAPFNRAIDSAVTMGIVVDAEHMKLELQAEQSQPKTADNLIRSQPCKIGRTGQVGSSYERVHFQEPMNAVPMAGMVKVFGCREAYENLPSTNSRAACADLWGFPVLTGRGDGVAGVVIGSSASWRGRFFVWRAVARPIGAAEIGSFRPVLGDGHALGHWPKRERCGVRWAQAVPGHDEVLPVGAGA